MRRATTLAIALALVVPMIVEAHRLDEYLQATRLSLAPDHIFLEMDLTPGVEVAPMVFALINADRDGRISEAEGRAYATRFLQDVVFELDGSPLHLKLTGSRFPAFEDMREGTGTIRVEAQAAWHATAGPHSLFFRNTHQAEVGAYLVNVLVPASPEIKIINQQRDWLQHEMRLDINVERSFAEVRPKSSILVAFAVGFSTLLGLICFRWL
jgi:hypothetical protein